MFLVFIIVEDECKLCYEPQAGVCEVFEPESLGSYLSPCDNNPALQCLKGIPTERVKGIKSYRIEDLRSGSNNFIRLVDSTCYKGYCAANVSLYSRLSFYCILDIGLYNRLHL